MTPRRRKRLRRLRKLYRARRRVREYCESPLFQQRKAEAIRKLDNRPPNLGTKETKGGEDGEADA